MIEADFIGFVDQDIPGTLWKRKLDYPGRCGPRSTKYRDLLPVEPQALAEGTEIVEGLYFIHQLKILRVFLLSCVCVGIRVGNRSGKSDNPTGARPRFPVAGRVRALRSIPRPDPDRVESKPL